MHCPTPPLTDAAASLSALSLRFSACVAQSLSASSSTCPSLASSSRPLLRLPCSASLAPPPSLSAPIHYCRSLPARHRHLRRRPILHCAPASCPPQHSQDAWGKSTVASWHRTDDSTVTGLLVSIHSCSRRLCIVNSPNSPSLASAPSLLPVCLSSGSIPMYCMYTSI
ncbi:hypothetical protein OH76DRAFT_1412104, partial [Lentinus brumalis]